eukprot:4334215-Pyramimonas_sp.AAC.1
MDFIAGLVACRSGCLCFMIRAEVMACICVCMKPSRSIMRGRLATRTACCSAIKAKCLGCRPSQVEAVRVGKLFAASRMISPVMGPRATRPSISLGMGLSLGVSDTSQ